MFRPGLAMPDRAGAMRADGMEDATNRKNLLLLVQLRWIAVVGQLATILVVLHIFAIDLPLLPMALVVAFLIGLNVVSLLRCRFQPVIGKTELFLELLLDVGALTVQLYLSGGALNPFVSLFLLQVILGTILLETALVWLLVAITGGCFIFLSFFHQKLGMPARHEEIFLSLHVPGMFICFLLSACLLVLYITRITRNLAERDARLSGLRQQAAEEDHIVRMGLLASGAAHELGTPLSTLSVILSDWQRMPQFAASPDLRQDLEDMQAQITRCKGIVSGILLSSGETRGEGAMLTSVARFFDGLVTEWQAARAAVACDYSNLFDPDLPIISDLALKQVVVNLLDNAADASPEWVGITVGRREGRLLVTVNDAGPGFAPEILAEIGRPYRSTKDRPGAGLGLFLVVNVVRKLGGTVEARNDVSGGASVTVSLPLKILGGERAEEN
jgi:two-component system sensor histidine kinase RegB